MHTKKVDDILTLSITVSIHTLSVFIKGTTTTHENTCRIPQPSTLPARTDMHGARANTTLQKQQQFFFSECVWTTKHVTPAETSNVPAIVAAERYVTRKTSRELCLCTVFEFMRA